MNFKLLDAYLLIEKIFSAGIADDAEIIKLLQEFQGFNEDGAIMALASYYDDKKQIKDYIKKNKLSEEKTGFQLGA